MEINSNSPLRHLWSLLPSWVVLHSGLTTKLTQGGSLAMTMGLLLGSVFCGSEVASRTQGKRSPIIRGSKCRSYPKTTLSVLLCLSLSSAGSRGKPSWADMFQSWPLANSGGITWRQFLVPWKPNLTYPTAEAPARWAWCSASLYLALPPDSESSYGGEEGVPCSYLC